MKETMAVIAFTGQGRQLAQKLIAGLRENPPGGSGCNITGYATQEKTGTAGDQSIGAFTPSAGLTPAHSLISFTSLKELVKELWPQSQALIFIGACGIAVRSIAPYVKDKTRDPAVLVLDEKGRFVISLLSGHIGGANELTLAIAGLIGAQPVITTATDINQVFAVDSWAIKAGLHIVNPQAIKEISGSLLAGRPVGFISQYPVKGPLPAGLEDFSSSSGNQSGSGNQSCSGSPARPEAGIRIASAVEAEAEAAPENPESFDTPDTPYIPGPPETAASVDSPESPLFPFTLHLQPKNLVLGCGCRRGVSEAQIREAVFTVLQQHNLSPRRLRLISSIDLKSDEKGLLDFAAAMELPLVFFSADQLAQAPGDFTPSAYVKEVTGVDNVCERSALLGARRFAEGRDSLEGNATGRLLIPKTSLNGVTVAVYEQDFTVIFP